MSMEWARSPAAVLALAAMVLGGTLGLRLASFPQLSYCIGVRALGYCVGYLANYTWLVGWGIFLAGVAVFAVLALRR